MQHRMTAVERAFELARSGRVSGLSEIVEALKRVFRKSDRRSRFKATASRLDQSCAGEGFAGPPDLNQTDRRSRNHPVSSSDGCRRYSHAQ
jgi:hypothetical protein